MAGTGRPSKYRPEFAKSALTMMENGATVAELGKYFGVTERTVWRWMAEKPEFCHAVKAGGAAADERVELSMYQKACGYQAKETRCKYEYSEDEDGKKVKTLVAKEVLRKTIPPDTGAGTFWLKNRKPDEWRDRREITGPDGQPLSDTEVSQRIMTILMKDAEARVLN